MPATLDVPHDGLGFPPCGADELASVLRPKSLGGVLDGDGMVEVVSSLQRDGAPGRARSALGRLCGVQGAERICRGLFQAIWLADRSDGPLCGDVQAVPSDRARTVDLGAQCRAARRADRKLPRPGAATPWRSPSARSRPARRSTAKAAITVYAKLIPAERSLKLGALADRACASRQGVARRRRGRNFDRGRRGARRQSAGRAHPPRDGAAGVSDSAILAAE